MRADYGDDWDDQLVCLDYTANTKGSQTISPGGAIQLDKLGKKRRWTCSSTAFFVGTPAVICNFSQHKI